MEKDTGRLEAFSDGVFAVAITLLALDLQVPQGSFASPSALLRVLAREWPSYLAFVTSFFTVLIMWVNHHGLLRLLRRSHQRLLFANGYLLLVTTLVPFSTSLLTRYLLTPAAKAACLVYGGVFVLISFAFQALLRCVFSERALLRTEVSHATAERIRKAWRRGPPLYIIATLGALLSPYLTIGICTALWIYWIATAREF